MLPVEGEIGWHVVVDQRLTGPVGRSRIGDRAQRFVLDRDELSGILGLRPGPGDDEGDRIADMTNAIGAEHGALRMLTLRAVAVLHRDQAGQLIAAGRSQLVPGNYCQHARRRAGGLDIERSDPGVRFGRAHDAAIDLPVEVDIVGVATLAGDEPLILDPPHRLADPELPHGALPHVLIRLRRQHSPTDTLCQPRLGQPGRT